MVVEARERVMRIKYFREKFVKHENSPINGKLKNFVQIKKMYELCSELTNTNIFVPTSS